MLKSDFEEVARYRYYKQRAEVVLQNGKRFQRSYKALKEALAFMKEKNLEEVSGHFWFGGKVTDTFMIIQKLNGSYIKLRKTYHVENRRRYTNGS